MASSLYAWTFTDPFHKIIILVTTGISCFSNSLLLFIISTTNSDNIGSYRYLLAFFSICNLTTTLGHVSLEWYCHMTTTGFYFFPRQAAVTIFGVPFATVFCLMFIVTYYQVFLILAFHFVYRYKTVTRGLGSSFTDKWKRRHWVAAAIISYLLYISGFVSTVGIFMSPTDQTRRYVPPEVLQTYGVDFSDPNTGYIVISMRTCIPMIFSYFPLSLILLFGGLSGISLGSFGNVLFLVTAIFPSVDAFFVLFFIVKFRIAVIKLFHLPFKTNVVSSVEQRGTITNVTNAN